MVFCWLSQILVVTVISQELVLKPLLCVYRVIISNKKITKHMIFSSKNINKEVINTATTNQDKMFIKEDVFLLYF